VTISMDNIELIAESSEVDLKESTSQGQYENVMMDIGHILSIANEPKEVFLNFIAWQKEFLQSLNAPYSCFESLCKETLDLRKAHLNTTQVENLKRVVEENLSTVSIDSLTSQPDQIVEFHFKLFKSMDATSGNIDMKIFRKEVPYILDYVALTEKEGDTVIFERYVEWQTNLLAALNIEKLSLIRCLVTIKMFVDAAKKDILDYGIRYLVLTDEKDAYIKPEEVSEEITNKYIQLFPGIESLSIELYRDKIKNDTDKHLIFLKQALQINSKAIFTEYVHWTCSTLEIETITLIRSLVLIRMVVPQTQLKDAIPFLDEAISSLVSYDTYNSPKEKSYLANPKAKKYLSLILEGQRKEAANYIFELSDGGMDLEEIYIDIFQSAQYEIGRLWENNEVSVAQEHYCTATTQMIMSMLYPRLFSSKSVEKSVVATCVGNELHEIGIRMVADFLDSKGWDTYYVGANTPTNAILDAIDKYKADLIAISVTLTPHINKAIEMIKEIRVAHPHVKILVGGYPFIQDPDLYKKIGADGYVKSAQEVHQKAISLFND